VTEDAPGVRNMIERVKEAASFDPVVAVAANIILLEGETEILSLINRSTFEI